MTRWYGSKQSLELMRQKLEQALAITFEPRESSYWGGGYWYWEESGFTIKLFANSDVDDGEPVALLKESYPTVVLIESDEDLNPELLKTLGQVLELHETARC